MPRVQNSLVFEILIVFNIQFVAEGFSLTKVLNPSSLSSSSASLCILSNLLTIV